MVRFKFFVFALLVLGLGAAHLPLVSGPLSNRAVEGASAPAIAAISEVSRALESRRTTVMALALSLAGSPEVAAAVQPQVEPLPRGKGIRIIEPPVAERFSSLRSVLGERLAAASAAPLGESLVLGLVTAEGVLYARGAGEATSDAQFDVRALQDAGSAGKVQESFGAPHVFFSVPVLWSPDGGRAQVAATVVVGAPTLDPAALDSAAALSGVTALALVKGDQVLASSGPEKDLAAQALGQVVVGQSGRVVTRGGVAPLMASLPRVSLPLFTDASDLFKARAPLAVASRRPLAGGDLELVAVTSLVPFMTSLADYQRLALFALAGLLGLSLVWTLLMGASPAAAPEKSPKETGKQAGKAKGARAEVPAAVTAPPAGPVFTSPPPPEPPSAGPDDFPFPATPPARAAAMAAEPLPAPTAPPVASAFPEPAAAPMTPFADASGAPLEADPYAASPGAASTYNRPSAPTGDLYPFSTPEAPRDPFGTPTMPGMDPFATPTVPGKDPFAALGGTALPFPSADPAANVPPASPRRGSNFEFEDHPTAAYSLQQAADPFAAATAQARLQNGGFDDEGGSPEPTRVATIPQELLARSARPMTGEVQVPPSVQGQHPGVASSMSGAPGPGMAVVKPSTVISSPFGGGAGAVALSEEQHFQEVFREFVQTRDQCGEPQDGLTYDKFVAKLRKNREQLVQKYACKTVRFQVYVKEGKAALKATPVKD